MKQFHFPTGAKHSVKTFCFLILMATGFACNEAGTNGEKQSANDTIATHVKNEALIDKGKLLIREGDLLTRSDDDFESLSLQNFSKRDRTYSHSGIVFKEDGAWFVYHAMAGAENPGASIKREPFDSFVNPLKKTGFGVFRYQLSSMEINTLHTLYKKYYAEKLPFDKSFNLKTDDSMYCSEIIYKSLKKVTGNRVILPTSYFTNFKPKTTNPHFKNAFFKKFEYVGLDDLYLNSFCKKIFAVQFR
jgi:Permuted papain-like amidase enzyme, YaeF/YiiX, C92 family